MPEYAPKYESMNPAHRDVAGIAAEIQSDVDFVAAETTPWQAHEHEPLDTRVALISSGALHLSGDAPFRACRRPATG